MSAKQALTLVLATIVSVNVASAAYFDDDTGDGMWTTDENWDSDLVPQNEDARINAGFTAILDAPVPNVNRVRVGIAGSFGELYIVEGAEVTSTGGGGQDFVGEGGGTTGSLLDQSGGTYTIANQGLNDQNPGYYVGHKSGGDGTYNMSGGMLDIQDGRLVIGAGDTRDLGNSNGVMTITGGTVLAEAGIEVGGFETEVGRLDVRGSDADQIVGGYSGANDNGGVYIQTDQGTLAVGIDAGGITPIEILVGGSPRRRCHVRKWRDSGTLRRGGCRPPSLAHRNDLGWRVVRRRPDTDGGRQQRMAISI